MSLARKLKRGSVVLAGDTPATAYLSRKVRSQKKVVNGKNQNIRNKWMRIAF